MARLKVDGPIVEMTGDEMAQHVWELVRDRCVLERIDLSLETFDLGIANREATKDEVTRRAAEAVVEHGVAVKCSTITPDEDGVRRHGLSRAWPSPNVTIRNHLEGTIFRKPVLVPSVPPRVRNWKKPIIVGRHAFGDLFRSEEYHVSAPGVTRMTYTPDDRSDWTKTVELFTFDSPGVIMGMHNTEASVRSFAQTCLDYALAVKMDVWFSTQDTISKAYHGMFREIFRDEADKRKDEFERAGIRYRYLLVDDAASRVMRSEGGFIWALRNYDGDVMSDLIAAGFSSLGMMRSVLVSPHGCYLYELPHGTVSRHWRRHLEGEATSTNPVATMLCWSSAIRRRGRMDERPDVVEFADAFEETVLAAIEAGHMTRDLATQVNPGTTEWESTEGFVEAVRRLMGDRLDA